MAIHMQRITGGYGGSNGDQTRVAGDVEVHRGFRRNDGYAGPNLLAMLGIERFTSTAHYAVKTVETITKENRMSYDVAMELELR